MGCHSLLQGIFPIQGSGPRHLSLLHWQAGSLLLEPPEKSCTDWINIILNKYYSVFQFTDSFFYLLLLLFNPSTKLSISVIVFLSCKVYVLLFCTSSIPLLKLSVSLLRVLFSFSFFSSETAPWNIFIMAAFKFSSDTSYTYVILELASLFIFILWLYFSECGILWLGVEPMPPEL